MWRDWAEAIGQFGLAVLCAAGGLLLVFAMLALPVAAVVFPIALAIRWVIS